jgi:hypothetical protein
MPVPQVDLDARFSLATFWWRRTDVTRMCKVGDAANGGQRFPTCHASRSSTTVRRISSVSELKSRGGSLLRPGGEGARREHGGADDDAPLACPEDAVVGGHGGNVQGSAREGAYVRSETTSAAPATAILSASSPDEPGSAPAGRLAATRCSRASCRARQIV